MNKKLLYVAFGALLLASCEKPGWTEISDYPETQWTSSSYALSLPYSPKTQTPLLQSYETSDAKISQSDAAILFGQVTFLKETYFFKYAQGVSDSISFFILLGPTSWFSKEPGYRYSTLPTVTILEGNSTFSKKDDVLTFTYAVDTFYVSRLKEYETVSDADKAKLPKSGDVIRFQGTAIA
jgi:hypothetical protein